MRASICLLISLCTFLSTNFLREASAEDPVLVRVQTRSTVKVGELVESADDVVTFLDLETRRSMTIPKDEIVKFTKPATIEEASIVAGLPSVTAWKIGKLVTRERPVGKVAKVTPQAVYLTLGQESGLSADTELSVYRLKSEIKDPDTGEVIAIERPRIAKLKVIEAADKYSKATIQGELEVELQVGDEVEKSADEVRVAVCPIYHEDGTLTNVGATLSEDITTELVQRKVPVVERTVLNTVLPELLAQNTVLFDTKSAQKLGKLAGASVVVTGKIVPQDRRGTAYVRLVDVESGRILLAASSSISLSKAKIVGSNSGASGSSKSLISLTDKAPAGWLIKQASRGARIWHDGDYFITSLPREMSRGVILVQSKGKGDEWLKPNTLNASKPAVVYAVIRWKYLGKPTVGELKFSQFERDGWKRLEDPVKTTFPPGEDWQWTALKLNIPSGKIAIPLKTVNWGQHLPVFFVFAEN